MKHLSIDIETFSSIDIKKAGLYRYAQSPDFQILLFAYSYDGGPVQIVDLAQGQELPESVFRDLASQQVIKHAYNAAFEWYCINRYCRGVTPVDQWRCTMLHGLYCGYPAGLGVINAALGLPQDKRKMGVGTSLIRLFCCPTKPTTKNGQRTRTLPHHEPEKWNLFKEYCRQDVVAEMEVERRLSAFPVPEQEQRLWELDLQMNATGAAIDLDLVRGALAVDEVSAAELMAEAKELTGLDNPKSVAQLSKWLQEETGEEVENLRKGTVADMLAGMDEGKAKRMMEIRLELAKASVKKYDAMMRAVCDDGRVRGLLQFYGANRTGRWCLAEGTQVLVKDSAGQVYEKPIERVLLSDLVFDGDDWVAHEGVVFSGEKEVISWDGITATSTHIVFVSDDEKIPLQEARDRRLAIWRGNTKFTK